MGTEHGPFSSGVQQVEWTGKQALGADRVDVRASCFSFFIVITLKYLCGNRISGVR